LWGGLGRRLHFGNVRNEVEFVGRGFGEDECSLSPEQRAIQ
jgi:hypothetical protein